MQVNSTPMLESCSYIETTIIHDEDITYTQKKTGPTSPPPSPRTSSRPACRRRRGAGCRRKPNTTLYYTILYYTILYYTILYYTILYYAVTQYSTLYYNIIYYTILYHVGRRVRREPKWARLGSGLLSHRTLKSLCRKPIPAAAER